MKKYETEARSRWGNTDVYREYEEKTKNYTKEKWAEAITFSAIKNKRNEKLK